MMVKAGKSTFAAANVVEHLAEVHALLVPFEAQRLLLQELFDADDVFVVRLVLEEVFVELIGRLELLELPNNHAHALFRSVGSLRVLFQGAPRPQLLQPHYPAIGCSKVVIDLLLFLAIILCFFFVLERKLVRVFLFTVLGQDKLACMSQNSQKAACKTAFA